MELDLHLPGYLQGAQYEYERHIMRPIEGVVSVVLPMMPLMAVVMTTNQLVGLVKSRLIVGVKDESQIED